MIWSWSSPNQKNSITARHHRWHSRKVPQRIRKMEKKQGKIYRRKNKIRIWTGRNESRVLRKLQISGRYPEWQKQHVRQYPSRERKITGSIPSNISNLRQQELKNIETRTIWELIETSIVAITTHGCEFWKPNKGEIKGINRIKDNILKRVLTTWQSTARETLYLETGLLDPETINKKQNIMVDRERLNNWQQLKEPSHGKKHTI